MLQPLLFLILATIVILIVGMSTKLRSTSQLKKIIQNSGHQELIFMEKASDEAYREGIRSDTNIVQIVSSDLLNEKSLCRRFMKKTGRQSLPFRVWVDELGEVRGRSVDIVKGK